MDKLSSNYGGICIFYRLIYSVKEIKLPSAATFEVLAIYVHGAGKKFVLAAVYRPGSKSVTITQFVSDLADIIERLVV